MPSHHFKLQTVLDYRDEQLNQAQQKMAVAEGNRQKILNQIQTFDRKIDQAFQDQQAFQSETILDPLLLRQFPEYVRQLRQNRFQVCQTLEAQEKVLSGLREELKQALIRKKALTILKEKDEVKYRQRIDKAEEEFLSELALRRTNGLKTKSI